MPAKPSDPLHQHPPVPTAVENGDPAGARQVPPEPPQVIVRGFFVGGRGDLDHLIVAGVEGGGDAADAAALPAASQPSKTRMVEIRRSRSRALQLVQLTLVALQASGVVFLGQTLVHVQP